MPASLYFRTSSHHLFSFLFLDFMPCLLSSHISRLALLPCTRTTTQHKLLTVFSSNECYDIYFPFFSPCHRSHFLPDFKPLSALILSHLLTTLSLVQIFLVKFIHVSFGFLCIFINVVTSNYLCLELTE